MEITVTKNEFRNLVVSELKDYLEAKMSSEETKVLQFLIKHGANPKEAEKDVKKHYKDAKRIWRGSTPAKLANKISFLAANESITESHHNKKEGKMAKYDAKEIAEDSIAVFKMIDKDMDLPEWLEAKITKSADYMNTVKDYLTHHMKSDDSDNKNQSQNEDMKNTSKMMRAVRKGPKVGPWDIIVSKNNKIVKRVLVKNLKEIPAEMSDLRDKYPNHSIGIESKEGKIVYREGTCGYGVDGKLGEEPAGPHLLNKRRLLKSKKKKFDLDEACQKGYMTHPTRKTKIMFGKRYRNCVKKEGVDTTVTLEQLEQIADNICVNCGDFTNENLIKWCKQKWVNIGKKKKGGGHPPCGTSGKKRGYAKCVPAAKAASMTKKQKASATRRKRAAQNKKGRGGTSSLKGGGKKPIYVSTKPKK